jgi:hypothetical protein
MKRLIRILLRTGTVLSLILCVAAWARSYRARDILSWSLATPRMRLGIGTYRGGLFAGVTTRVGTNDSLLPPGWRWNRHPPVGYVEAGGAQGSLFNRFGFALADDRYRHALYRVPVLVHRAVVGGAAVRRARLAPANPRRPWALLHLRLRPPRHARPLPGVRYNSGVTKRLLRILLNAVMVVSLLVCVATLVLWVRSYSVSESLTWRWFPNPGQRMPMRMLEVRSHGGEVTGNRWDLGAGQWSSLPPAQFVDQVNLRFPRPLYGRGMGSGTLPYAKYPHWCIALTFAALAAVAWYFRRAPTVRGGCCPACGYDLRATPDRCPECGTIPTR